MGGHRSTNSLGRMGEEEEDESPGGGRCITTKSGHSGQGGSPMCGGKPHDSTAFRRTSSRDSGGSVAPSSTLTPLSSTGIFKSPSSSVSSHVVVPADDASGRAAAPSLQPMQQRMVSSESLPPQKQAQQQPLPSMQQQQLQAMQQQHRQQQFSRSAAGGGGTQWDDVVRRMTTPQSSGHSLEMGSVDVHSIGSQPPVKSELDPLLVSSTNSVGTWNSNDSQVALLGPMPPPQSVQPPLRGWSFDSSQVDGNTGGMVVDLSDVDTLFPGSPDGKSNVTSTNVATASAAKAGAGGITGSNDGLPRSSASCADAGAGKQQQQPEEETMPGAKWTSDNPLPMEKVVIEPSRNVRSKSVFLSCMWKRVVGTYSTDVMLHVFWFYGTCYISTYTCMPTLADANKADPPPPSPSLLYLTPTSFLPGM